MLWMLKHRDIFGEHMYLARCAYEPSIEDYCRAMRIDLSMSDDYQLYKIEYLEIPCIAPDGPIPIDGGKYHEN